MDNKFTLPNELWQLIQTYLNPFNKLKFLQVNKNIFNLTQNKEILNKQILTNNYIFLGAEVTNIITNLEMNILHHLILSADHQRIKSLLSFPYIIKEPYIIFTIPSIFCKQINIDSRSLLNWNYIHLTEHSEHFCKRDIITDNCLPKIVNTARCLAMSDYIFDICSGPLIFQKN
jgi:hypothetical protein